MATPTVFQQLPCTLVMMILLAPLLISARIVEHTFHVENVVIRRLCREQTITTVNGSLPGPTIRVREGDTLLVHVLNDSPYNVTIHWHGIFQTLSCWADGPEYVTQCPIRSGHRYTYRFKIEKQEGTLWWHAHVSWLRATVYGALIILPRYGHAYPFPKPYREFPIILGEWWNANIIHVGDEALHTGSTPNISDAFTINGKPGDLYPCSSADTYRLNVQHGKTYLLRIINAALNNQLFFKIADHKMTVVAVDASYTSPYVTELVVLGPGQTTDVLLKAYQPSALYYMAARPYVSVPESLQVPFDNTTATGIIAYRGVPRRRAPSTTSRPKLPIMPNYYDTPTAHKFYSNLTGLVNGRFLSPVPLEVDEHMFVTIGLGFVSCKETGCSSPNGLGFAASMNNQSFELPTKLSMLQAFFSNEIEGIYTTDFPDKPPLEFDYTNPSNSTVQAVIMTTKSTKVKKVKFNSTIEIVFQDTALIGIENHPMHLHGFNFKVLAQGFGNYNPLKDKYKFNLVNPQVRNTISVPTGGWAVIRFQANNPGIWIMHCHLEVHLPWGLATAFQVENGPTESTKLPPPPPDLPSC